jgi:ferritin-like metal-binding protein YciE
MPELKQMLVDQFKDAYSAEKQGIAAMRKIIRQISEPALKQGMQAHLEQGQSHLERIEGALETLGAKPGRKVCEAMRGLVEEAMHEVEEQEKGPVMDIVIVAAQQRMEHYEIAAYGTMAELAKALGEEEVARIAGEILQDEKQQDERLTEITRSTLLPAALQGGGEEDEEEEAPKPRRAAKRA